MSFGRKSWNDMFAALGTKKRDFCRSDGDNHKGQILVKKIYFFKQCLEYQLSSLESYSGRTGLRGLILTVCTLKNKWWRHLNIENKV